MIKLECINLATLKSMERLAKTLMKFSDRNIVVNYINLLNENVTGTPVRMYYRKGNIYFRILDEEEEGDE